MTKPITLAELEAEQKAFKANILASALDQAFDYVNDILKKRYQKSVELRITISDETIPEYLEKEGMDALVSAYEGAGFDVRRGGRWELVFNSDELRF